MKTSVTVAIGVGGGSVVVVVVVVVVSVAVSVVGIPAASAAAASTGNTASTIMGSTLACTTGIGSGRRKGGPSGGGCSPDGFLSYSSTVTVTGEGGVTSREPWIVRSYPGRTTLGAINR